MRRTTRQELLLHELDILAIEGHVLICCCIKKFMIAWVQK